MALALTQGKQKHGKHMGEGPWTCAAVPLLCSPAPPMLHNPVPPEHQETPWRTQAARACRDDWRERGCGWLFLSTQAPHITTPVTHRCALGRLLPKAPCPPKSGGAWCKAGKRAASQHCSSCRTAGSIYFASGREGPGGERAHACKHSLSLPNDTWTRCEKRQPPMSTASAFCATNCHSPAKHTHGRARPSGGLVRANRAHTDMKVPPTLAVEVSDRYER